MVTPFLYLKVYTNTALHSFPTRRTSDLKRWSSRHAVAKPTMPPPVINMSAFIWESLPTSSPILYLQAFDPGKLLHIVGHQGNTKRQGMRRDEKIHGSDGLAGRFQHRPDF